MKIGKVLFWIGVILGILVFVYWLIVIMDFIFEMGFIFEDELTAPVGGIIWHELLKFNILRILIFLPIFIYACFLLIFIKSIPRIIIKSVPLFQRSH